MLSTMGASENGVRGDRPHAAAMAGKMTAPSRRTEELAQVERQLLVTEDGQVTRAMDVMSLVEAEQRLAREVQEAHEAHEAKESTESGVRPIAVAPSMPREAARAAPSPVRASLAPATRTAPPPRSIAPSDPGRRRRQTATFVVTVLMLVAASFVAVALLRSGLTLSGVVSLVLRHWKH
jgi:hypothetical protein